MNDYQSKLLFLEKILGKAKYSSNTHEAEFFCKFCNHYKRKLSINLENDHYQCWVCGQSGKNLVFLLKKIGFGHCVKEYLECHKAKNVNVKVKQFDSDFVVSLPDGFIPIVECKGSVMGKKAIDYLTRVRKVEEIDILRYKLGVVIDGDYRDGIIFPSFDKFGAVNYFTVRCYDGRKMSPFVPRGYKNTIILNEINIDWSKSVTITEGPIDMLKSGTNTIPLFGGSLMPHSKLFKTIVSNKTPVVLGLDVDAESKYMRMAKNFMRYDVSCYIMDMSPYGDLGEMSKVESAKREESAMFVTENDIFKSKLRSIC